MGVKESGGQGLGDASGLPAKCYQNIRPENKNATSSSTERDEVSCAINTQLQN